MLAYAALTSLAEPLGLRAQPAKSAVYSANAAAAASVATRLSVHLAPDGLLAAGTPVGTPAFQAANAVACASHAFSLMDEMQALPLADQDRWLLLHGSLQVRVAHLPRGCDWQHVGPAVWWAEDMAADGVFAILEVPHVDGHLTERINLPLHHGGLGLSHTTTAHA
jgi:hypothetical protein